MNIKHLAKIITAIDELPSGFSASECRDAIAKALGDDAAYFFNSTPLDLVKLVCSATFGSIFEQLVELQGV